MEKGCRILLKSGERWWRSGNGYRVGIGLGRDDLGIGRRGRREKRGICWGFEVGEILQLVSKITS